MKVRIEFTVDIDPEAWAEEYGVERNEVREDVRVLIESEARTHLSDVGVVLRD